MSDERGMKDFPIRQVSTEGMSDEEKAKIDPVHRLMLTPTSKEARLLELMIKGSGMGLSEEEEKEYEEARQAVEDEKKQAREGK